MSAREDVLLRVLRDFLTAYTLTSGRKKRLAELLPADAAAKKAQTTDAIMEVSRAFSRQGRPGRGCRLRAP